MENPGDDKIIPRLPSHFGQREESGRQLQQLDEMDEQVEQRDRVD